ncbi:type I-E CRISPR-associated protein Cas6/Cse3/CasE [Amaricoccus solimangrovi]|uniref:Type I-E CRISPR-associated protein Cas6/Cse3/CasE n=1 Tax=Amaricoccus solimangrovi TaxID=2589815 RepID=A0A501WKY0_9RHOB|nr:type I-E CRISPR-associated protein Cas6/Cse3/CasE [Amaricoccus solimangrovi]TPE47867.1 type I-E CRISPR-associated protein Cas6/Cse3/CasE [Amaricoccus solimangrovi]
MTLYLSRLRLSRKPSARALDAIINPEEPGPRIDAHHRLLWAAFADNPDRKRDFLWREQSEGEFLTLSARPPAPSELFEAPAIKDFGPRLAPGDRLSFALRANATRARKGIGRVDVVMDALHALPKGARAPERIALAQREGAAWLSRQGERAGFRLIGTEVGDYSVAVLPGHRGRRERQPQFGILDMTGLLEITDPPSFLIALSQGFGRAKAFGCGLMLIRRAE